MKYKIMLLLILIISGIFFYSISYNKYISPIPEDQEETVWITDSKGVVHNSRYINSVFLAFIILITHCVLAIVVNGVIEINKQ